MTHLRSATKEEIESIKDKSDFTPGTIVLAMDNGHGGTDLAVVRPCWEVDPIFIADSSGDSQKARFMWGLEERMIGAGITGYYFNMPADDASKQWRKVAQSWGAEPVSKAPEWRYRKVLVKAE